ncbi:MAG: PKD-like domain-containing protein [Bacteroidia bacterium]
MKSILQNKSINRISLILLLFFSTLLINSNKVYGQTLDQTSNGNGDDWNLTNSSELGQSFTAGLSGTISRIELKTANNNSSSATFNFILYQGDGYGGTVLNSQSISSPSSAGTTFQINYASGITLTTGQKYTFRLQWTSGSSKFYAYGNNNGYSGGDFYLNGSIFSPARDLDFKTYVTANSALHFDGSNDYIDFPVGATADYESQTVEFWFKYSSLPGSNRPIFIRGEDGSGAGWSFQVQLQTNGRLNSVKCCLTSNSGSPNMVYGTHPQGNSTLSANTWYHIASVHDNTNGETRVYLNGNLELTGYYSPSPLRNSGVGYRFGRDNLGGQFINQFVDEIRIWNVARTQSEIQNNLNGMTAPFSGNLKVYHKLNEGTPNANNTGLSSTLVDATAGSFSGTMNNFAKNGTTSNWVSYNPVNPTIATSGSLSAFTTCSGTPSSQQSFSVSGLDLTSNLVVSAPSGFEVSTNSGSGYGSSVSLSPSSGTINATNIYVRLSSGASGNPSGNISCSSTGATTQNVSANGTVNAIPSASISYSGSPFCATGSVNVSQSGQGGGSYSSSGGLNINSSNGQINLAASSAGSYTVTYSFSSNGCSNTTTASVTINALPTASAGGSQSICPTSTATVSGASASNYSNISWAVSGNANFPATVTVVNLGSCCCLGGTYNYAGMANGAPYYLMGGYFVLWDGSKWVNTDQGLVSPSFVVSGFYKSNTTGSISNFPTTNWVNNSGTCDPANVTFTTSGSLGGSITAGANTLSPTYTPSLVDGGRTITLTMTATGSGACSGQTATATYTVNVYSQPTATVSGGGTICSGATLPNVSFAFTGTGPWTFTYTNGTTPTTVNATSSNPYTITNAPAGTYSVTALNNANCAGTYSGSASVIVNPLPTLTNTTANVCSGSLFNFTAAANITNAGSFTWTRNSSVFNTLGLITPAPSGSNNSGAISETLTNTSAVALNETYTLNLTSNLGCVNPTPATLTLTVKPKPIASASPSSQSICSGNSISNVTFSSNVTGTTYSWTSSVNNVSGIADGSNASGPITGSLTNSGVTTQNEVYTVTPSASSCVGNNFTATVTVNSTPVLSSNLTPATICSGTTFTYTPTTATPGASFAWTRATVAGISNAAGSGSNGISEVLTNTTTSPIVVTYIYTLSNNGCNGNSSVTVTIDPLPTATAGGNQSICSNTAAFVSGAVATSGTILWSHNGSGNLSNANTLTPTYTAALGDESLTRTLTMTVTSNNTCVAATATATYAVLVNPLPTATISGSTNVCIGNTSPNLTFTGAAGTAPYTFTYTINGGANQTVTTTVGNSVTVAAPTGTTGDFTYSLINVSDNNTCSKAVTGQSALIAVKPLPTASIGGSNTVCINTSSPDITFTGANGTIPYTFTYKINGGADQTVTTTSGNSVTVAAPTSTSGTFTYSLVGVQDFYGCNQSQSGSAIINVNPLPTATAGGSHSICSNGSYTLNNEATASNGTILWTKNNGALGNLTNTTTLTPTYTAAAGDAGNAVTLTMTVTSDNACGTATANATYTVNVNTLPTASTSGNATICSNGSYTLIGGEATATNGTIAWTSQGSSSFPQTIIMTEFASSCNNLGGNYLFVGNANGAPKYKLGQYLIMWDGTKWVNTEESLIVNNVVTVSYKFSNSGNINTFPTNNWVTGYNPCTFSAVTFNLIGSLGGSITAGANTLTPTYTPNASDAGTNVTLTMTVTSNNSCAPQTATANYTVHVDPLPTATAGGSATICSNASATVSGATSSNGTVLWSHNGSGNISNGTTLTPTYNAVTADAGHAVILTMTVTSNNTCNPQTATATYTVNVNPLPTANAGGSHNICHTQSYTLNNEATASNGTILWSHNGTGSLTNGTTLTPTYAATIADAGNAVTITMTVTSTIACSPAITASAVYTINVGALPVLNNTTANTCSGSLFAFNANTTPSANYTWTRNEYILPGLITPAPSGTNNAGPISETLTNNTNQPIDITYILNLTSTAGCPNPSPATLTVTIKPKPIGVATPASQFICSGLAITDIALSNSNNVTGTNYSWTSNANNISGIIDGNGNTISGNLNNGGLITQNEVFTITPSANGCNGAAFTSTVTVNPTPMLSSNLTSNANCSGTAYTYTPTSLISGATFAWTRATVAGISNGSGSGSNGINETLVNTTPNAIDATYIYSVSNNGCSGQSNLTVTVPPAISVSNVAQTTIGCNSGNATFTITAAGGTGTLSYTFDGVTNTSGIFTHAAGTNLAYSITDANNCTPATGTFTIVQPSVITVSNVSQNTIGCNGGNATVTITAAGGTGAYSYTFDGQTNGTGVFSHAAGTNLAYSVTDANNCLAATGTYTITQPSPISVSNVSQSTIACNGGNATVTIAASGGTGTLIYTFDGNSNGTGIFSHAAGTNLAYSVTDINNCSAVTGTFDVVQPSVINFGSISQSTITCNGGNAIVTITATGGTGTLSYTFDGITNTTGIFSHAAGTNLAYSITDANNCTPVTGTFDIVQPTAISFGSISQSTILCNAGNATVTITAAGGTGTLSYSFDGATNTTGIFTHAAGNNLAYSITDANNCAPVTGTFNIVQPSTISVSNVAHSTIACYGGNATVTISAAGGTGALSYTFDNVTNGSGVFTHAAATNLAYSVTDANNCAAATGTFNISQPAPVSVSNVAQTSIACNGGNATVTITAAGGTGALVYTFDGNSNATGIFTHSAGTNLAYSVTDVNGCTPATGVFNIVEPTLLTITNIAENPIACLGTTLTITSSGGTGTVEYSKDNGLNYQSGNVFTGLGSGVYPITVRDANSCVSAASLINVATPSSIIITNTTKSSFNGYEVSCSNSNDGTITVSSTGGAAPLEYSSDNGSTYQSSNVLNGLTAGTYQVRVRDANMCVSAATSVVMNAPNALTFNSATKTLYNNAELSCNTSSDGEITVVSAGGYGTIEYSKDNGLNFQSSNVFSGLSAGTYQLKMRDANSCVSAANSVTISAPSVVTISSATKLSYNGSDITCFGQSDGQITVNATGGTGTLQYTKGSVYQSSNVFTNLAPDPYTLIVKDANGCLSSSTVVTINQPVALSGNASYNGPICANTALILGGTISGGTGTLSYAWSGPNAYSSASSNSISRTVSSNATVGMSGLYTVVVTDANNCTFNPTTNVVVNTIPTASISGGATACKNAIGPNITFTGANGTAPYTFTYSINGTGSYTISTASALNNSVDLAASTAVAGTFTYTLLNVVDASASLCAGLDSGSVVITVLPKPILVSTAAPMANTICEGTSTSISCTNASITYGTPVYVSNGINNFSSAIGSEWSFPAMVPANVPTIKNYNGENVLGYLNNQQAVYSLSNLPNHDMVQIDFDLYIHDTWDGNNGNGTPDLWKMGVDGTNIINTNFSNITWNTQAYPNNIPASNAHNSGFVTNNLPAACNIGGGSPTTKYHISRVVPHTANALSIVLEALNLETVCNESWSIDNFEVQYRNIPSTSNFVWNTPASNNTQITVSPSVNTTYTATLGTCSETIDIIVNPTPRADFTINAADQCLAGNSFDYTNASTLVGGGAMTYAWTMTDASTASSTSTNVVGNTYAVGGSHQVNLVATSVIGNCTDNRGSVTKSISVNNPTTITASVPSPICAGTTVRLTANQFLGNSNSILYTANENNDFETTIGSKWTFLSNANNNIPTITTYNGGKVLGSMNNQRIEFNQTGLATHETVKVEFDLYIHGSWDGNTSYFGPETWNMDVNGTNVINTTFSNNWAHQSYPGNIPADNAQYTGAVATGLPNTTTKYHISKTINHTANNLTIGLEALGLEELVNESWSIDNFVVQVGATGLSQNLVSACDIVNGSPVLWNGGAATGASTCYVDVVPNTTTNYSVSIGGCSSANYTVNVSQTPAPAFTLNNGACSKTVSFTNTNIEVGATYTWSFGDASADYVGNTAPDHVYTSGTYTVTLSANFGAGCTRTATHSVSIGDLPTASFTAATGVGCGSNVQFTSTSTIPSGNVPAYLWSFGETPTPSTSNSQNPLQAYASAGSYNVSLTVTTGAGCSSTTSTNVNVIGSVVGNTAAFTTTVSGACGNYVETTNTSSGTGNTYLWNFGDGNTSNAVSPVHYYTDGGLKTITLTITNTGGCGGVLSHDVTVSANSGTNARVGASIAVNTSSQVLLGNSFNFSPTFTFVNNDIYTGESPSWTFGDGSTSSNTFVYQKHYAAAGNYTVRVLQKTGRTGCFGEASTIVTVLPNPLLQEQNLSNNPNQQVGVEKASASTGVNNVVNKLNNEVSLYPNPNKGTFKVQVNNMKVTNGSLTVVDMLGREVYQSTYSVHSNNDVIELNGLDLSSGTYHLILSDKGETKVRIPFVIVAE